MNQRAVIPIGLVAAVVLAGGGLVCASLRRPAIETWTPSPARPVEQGARLIGPLEVTIDAADSERWQYFDFSRGSRVDPAGPLEWDLAFRRTTVLTNGGPGFAGRSGVVALEGTSFEHVTLAPERGYVLSNAGRDSINEGVGKWYDYSLTSHLLTPRPRVYVVRTADGRYAKFEILGYYCDGPRPGCMTFRYTYQGDGTRSLGPQELGDPASAVSEFHQE